MSVFKDISSCTFNSVTLTEVMSVEVEEGSNTIRHAADASKHVTVVDAVDWTTTAKVNLKNLAQALVALTRGTKNSLVFTVKSGDGGSDKTYTLANCVFLGGHYAPEHGGYGSGSLGFEASSTNGSTVPLSVA
jgi:hypothetical protein